jgi:membrane-bound lytic murein transglycosylase D
MLLEKNYLLLLLLFIVLLNGCSTITQQSAVTQKNGNQPNSEFILNEQIAIDNVSSASKITQDDKDSLWDRIPKTYQLSDISNPSINIEIKWHIKHTSHLEKISVRATPYLYLIVEEVEKRGIPGELALLPFIESSFKPKAYSKKKAAGLWQFIPSTGKHFGLKQNWWYDGRQDVLLSTNAALDYLEQLSKYYNNDWLLALAAYNAGIGNVNKAIRKNRKKGKPLDFWSLPLPRETRNYVPKLLATANVIKNYRKYNIALSPIANKSYLTKVNTKSQIDLNVVSEMTDINITQLYTYNPALKRWATDPDGPHHLLLPSNKAEQFTLKLATLDNKDRVRWTQHKIKSGDTLSRIARKYQVSVQTIKKINQMKTSRIRAGKYILIPNSGNISSGNISSGNISQQDTQQMASSSIPQAGKSKWKSNHPHTVTTYTVKKGDSFWLIAKNHKMSHKRLASMNSLSSSDKLSIGQKLIIAEFGKPVTKISLNNLTKTSTKKITYKVRKGDSLYVISKRFNVSVNDLKQWNQLEQKKYIKPGQYIQVFINARNQTI